MCKSQLFFCLLFVCLIIRGQEPMEKPQDPANASNWEYDGFSYADFGTGEQHSYFSLMYKMNPNLYSELQGSFDTYLTADIVEFSYRLRWYPVKKIYLFSGVAIQGQRPKIGPGLPVVPVRIFNGVGYKPLENITIEAVHDLNFNENKVGKNAGSSLFTLKGKYRF